MNLPFLARLQIQNFIDFEEDLTEFEEAFGGFHNHNRRGLAAS